MDNREIEFRIGTLEFTLNIVKRNYIELEEIIKKYENEKSVHLLRDKELIKEYHIEFSRRLHNYLNSVYTIIEYSRIIRNKINNKNFNKLFQRKFSGMTNDEIFLFYKTLCTYLKHYDNPTTIAVKWYFSSAKDFDINTCSDEQFFTIETEELFDWDNCPDDLRYYLEEEDFKINIRDTIEEFHYDFIRMNTWFIDNVKDYLE